MRLFSKQTAVISIIVVMAITTACANIYQAKKSAQPPENNQQKGIQTQSINDAVIAVKTIGTHTYIPVNDLAKVLQYQTNWSSPRKNLQLGDTDANYEIQINTTRALKSGEAIQVNQPFLLQGDSAYLPVSALGDLFQEDMSYDIRDGQLLIHPSLKGISSMSMQEVDSSHTSGQSELNFADDPTDPNKASLQTSSRMNQRKMDYSISVLKQIDLNAVIQTAEKYLGVPYQFGAGPFPQTGSFDCSAFTQYVFGKNGVKLPRLSRQQAETGTLISRNNLRIGDLLFFSVPGRFKTNQTVGHVGIYKGNMQMIHASSKPENGVQISNIDSAYWKGTFLRARRVAV
ncbi:C40 family peptidase [Paenibacillus sp. GP183]|jgi:cell wall-associated NlpC family hydrolase|uniref:C40 family peptidase n=1 Tax=Paenibacillus sp. GP183 TaxID=1882751 RepID=UPI0008996A90|nr:C40 family peptidase [Paenibacillus sp. GP183]SEB90605.1 Cell wall-associated hydrolase, NlpC family [Paenibacillus sp. GP183]